MKDKMKIEKLVGALPCTITLCNGYKFTHVMITDVVAH